MIETNLILPLFTLLLGGNVFFFKRLVDRIDKTASGQATSQASMDRLTEQVHEIRTDVKELRRMEIDVAVLRSQFKPSSGNPLET